MPSTLIAHARLVDAERGFGGDLPNDDGRIARIEARLSAGANETVGDPASRKVLPRVIDNEVQLRETGMKREADIPSGFVRAAVALNVTSPGHLREGCATRPALVDDMRSSARREDVMSRCGGSPSEGRASDPRVASARADRRRASGGTHLVAEPNGQRLRFQR